MEKICGNCSHQHDGNYCSNCGQSANTHKINIHFLWHDIQHGFFHLDKGFLYTAKELYTRPGHAVREFIEGRRVKHFKPISFVLILAGVYGFLSHYFHINILANNIEVTGSGPDLAESKKIIEKINEWFVTHYAIVALVQIPCFAIGTFIAFIKSGYNFMEHLVLNSFLTGQRIILHIITFPLTGFFNGTATLTHITRVIDILGLVLFMWAIIQFFNRQKKIKVILKGLLSLLIFSLCMFVIIAIVAKTLF